MTETNIRTKDIFISKWAVANKYDGPIQHGRILGWLYAETFERPDGTRYAVKRVHPDIMMAGQSSARG